MRFYIIYIMYKYNIIIYRPRQLQSVLCYVMYTLNVSVGCVVMQFMQMHLSCVKLKLFAYFLDDALCSIKCTVLHGRCQSSIHAAK